MKFLYCTECAAPLKQQDATAYICANGHRFWNNPKPTASVIFLQGSDILVAQRAIDPFKGKYELPGGFIEYGENAYEAARREMTEEAKITLTDLELIDVYSNVYANWGITTCDVFFLALAWEGTFIASDDVATFDWKPYTFIDDADNFIWSYPGLTAKIAAYIKVQ